MVAELHAEALQERYRLLAENASDLVFHRGLDGTLTWVSPSVTQMLGYTQEELLGKDTVAMLVLPTTSTGCRERRTWAVGSRTRPAIAARTARTNGSRSPPDR